MQIKIFFDTKPVYLCNKLSKELQELTEEAKTLYTKETSASALKKFLKDIKKAAYTAGVICATDMEAAKKIFFNEFTIIEAAGGIVQNQEKEILFIFRRGKWDLPKGKIEKGETVELAAQREIEEETGVKGLKFKKKIHTTYHTYQEAGKDILKISHWFYFLSDSKQVLSAQTEENITEVKWIATKDIKTPMANSYDSIKELLTIFFDTP